MIKFQHSGVVNLSARFMQKAIEHAKGNKMRYLCLVDEQTKDVLFNL